MKLPLLNDAVPGCALPPAELAEQRDRYARLRPSVRRVQIERLSLEVELDAVDESLLREALAVESRCCPFFELDYAPPVLRIETTPEHASALAVLATTLSG